MGVILFLAIAGAVGAYIYSTTGKRFECPSCDLYITGARATKGDSVLCPHCREFALHDGTKLVKVPQETVAGRFLFCAELPLENIQWSRTCCVCFAPASRTVPLKISFEQDASLGSDMATRVATLGMFKSVDRHTFSLDVPHCAEHSDGATLMMPYEREQPNIGIAFRSYAHFLAFKELNRATPRKASMFGGQNEQQL